MLILLLLNGCKKDKITAADLIGSLTVSETDIPADGTTTIYVTAVINEDSDADK